MPIPLAVLLALLPSILFIGMMRWWDRREPEPPRLIVRLFLLGIVAFGIIFGIRIVLETMLVSLRFLPPSAALLEGMPTVTDAIIWSLLFALVAEGVKFLIGYFMTRNLDDFNQAVDGIVYLTAIAWGAVLVENSIILYQDMFDVPAFHLIFGTLLAGISSGFAGLAMGRFVISQRDEKQKTRGVFTLVGGLGAAVALHALFRFFIYMNNDRIAGLIVMVGGLYVLSRFLIARYVQIHNKA